MLALLFTAPGTVQMADVPAPTPGPDDVLVHVAASAICGSELHGFRALGFRVPPLIMGHEFAGTTDDGRRVVVNPLISCGECDCCQLGRPQVCRHRELLGVHRPGGFAEMVSVPSHAVRELPAHISFTAASLVEPLANAVHVCAALPKDTERVAIVGGGPVGVLCAQVATRQGADVTVCDTSPERRAAAADLGLSCVAELSSEYDAIVDAVGAVATRRTSVERVRPGGMAVWIGLLHDEVTFSGNGLVRDEKRVLGSFGYTPAEFDQAVELAAELDLGWATTFPLADAEAAFYRMAAGGAGVLKAVLVPSTP